MKNIAVLAVLVIIIGVDNSAYCQDLEKERKYGFSIGPQYGFVYGQSLELVYPNKTKGELLSELKWDMKPVFYSGIQIDFGLADLSGGPGFFSTASFKAGFGGDSGKMEDRDWMSAENGELTHFSSHTNSTREFYWLDIKAGASLPVKNYLYIKPFFSGSWMRFSFAGRDGYGIRAREDPQNPGAYFPIDNDPLKYSFKGMNVINYTQNWFLAATGLSAGTEILHPFSFELSFQISPFTYCAARDEHLTNNKTFLDFSGWGLFMEGGGSISFNAQRIVFSFDFNCRYIGKTIGPTYMKEDDGDFFPNGESGAGMILADIRFFVVVKF